MDKVNVALGAGTLGLAALLVFLLNQLHGERALPGALAREPASRDAAQADSPQETPARAPPSLTTDPSSTGQPRDAASPGAAQLEAFKDPQYRASAIAQRRIGVQAQLHDLPHWMDGSGEVLNGLVNLLAAQGVEDEEFHISNLGRLASEQTHLQQESLRQRHDSEIVQLLGPGRFQQWHTYREAESARRYLHEMNEHLSGGDLLAPEQARPIATAMTRAQMNLGDELRRLRAAAGTQPDASARLTLAEGTAELFRRQNELARAAVASQLSAQQLAALEAAMRRQERDREAALAMQRVELGN